MSDLASLVADLPLEAGSINVSQKYHRLDDGSHRVRLVEASTGLLNTIGQLESKAVLPYLGQSVIY